MRGNRELTNGLHTITLDLFWWERGRMNLDPQDPWEAGTPMEQGCWGNHKLSLAAVVPS